MKVLFITVLLLSAVVLARVPKDMGLSIKRDTVASCQFPEADGTKKPIHLDGKKWYILRTERNGKVRKQYVTKQIVLINTK